MTNLADRLNHLADHTTEPALMPDVRDVRRSGEARRRRVRRRLVLVGAAAVAVTTIAAVIATAKSQESSIDPVRPRPPAVGLAMFDPKGHIAFVAGDGSRRVLPMTNVDRFAVSPDGSRVAYIADNGRPAGRRLWLADLDGAGRRKVSPPCAGCEVGYGVAWSSDGARLAYVVWVPGRAAQVRIRTVDTGHEEVFRLPRGVEPRGPRISPDGGTLVLNAVVGAGEWQYVATLDLTAPAPVPRYLSGRYHQVQTPVWSDDGRFVYFTATTSGSNTNDPMASIDLYVTAADGDGDVRQITHARPGERYVNVTPYRDRYLVSRAVGDAPWVVGWLTDDGRVFQPVTGADGKPVLGNGAQVRP